MIWYDMIFFLILIKIFRVILESKLVNCYEVYVFLV